MEPTGVMQAHCGALHRMFSSIASHNILTMNAMQSRRSATRRRKMTFSSTHIVACLTPRLQAITDHTSWRWYVDFAYFCIAAAFSPCCKSLAGASGSTCTYSSTLPIDSNALPTQMLVSDLQAGLRSHCFQLASTSIHYNTTKLSESIWRNLTFRDWY